LDAAWGYHLGNVLLHAANGVLLFLFLLHATRNLRFAGVTAGLFASLAIHVEPVCWIMGRKDVLAAFFSLLALLVQSIALREQRPRRRLGYLFLVLLLYPLAVLSKFSAITLVLVLAAHRIAAPYLDGRKAAAAPFDWKQVRRTGLALLPHLGCGIALYRWYGHVLYEFQVIGGRGPSPFSLQHMKTLAVFVPLSIGRTVEHLFSSAEHSISYLRPNVALPLSSADVLVTLAVVVVSIAAIVLTVWRRKDLLFFVAAFFCWLAPYFNVEYIGIWVADRYAYLASIAVVAVLVRLTLDVLARARGLRRSLTVGAGAAALLWASYGVVTGREHQAAFHDQRSLWSYEAALPEPSILAFSGLTNACLREAESTSDPVLRRRLLGEIRTVFRSGVKRYRALPWLPARGYFIAARTEYAGLYGTLARAAKLAGASPELRVRYLRRSFEIYPGGPTALLLAQELFDLALPADMKLARESLEYCQLYAEKSWQDPKMREGIKAVFGNYLRAFPALTEEVRMIVGELGK
jgi:hypothetical protein